MSAWQWRRWWHAALVLCGLGVTVWVLLAVVEADPSGTEKPAEGQNTVLPRPAGTQTRPVSRAPRLPAAPALPVPPPASTPLSELLPPSDGALADHIHELEKRAARGDQAATRRLIVDLEHCATAAMATQMESVTVGGATAELRARYQRQRCVGRALCKGLSGAQIDSRWDWLWRAAEQGDPEARVVVSVGTLMYNEAAHKAAQRLSSWRQQAVGWMWGLARQGHPEAMLALAHSLSLADLNEFLPLAQLLPQDVETAHALLHALALASVNASHAENSKHLAGRMQVTARTMDSAQRARALQRGEQWYRQHRAALESRAVDGSKLYTFVRPDAEQLLQRFPQCRVSAAPATE